MRRLSEESGHGVDQVARAYAVARDAFGLRDVWAAIEALDNKVEAEVQTGMFEETMLLVERVTSWMLRHRAQPMAMGETVAAFRPAVEALQKKLPDLVSKARRQSMRRAAERYEKSGVPKDTAATVASLRTLAAVCDVVDGAENSGLDVIDIATVFFDVGEELGNEWLRDMVGRLTVEDRWDRLAQQALIEESFQQQRALTTFVLSSTQGVPADKATAKWIDANRAAVARTRAVLADLKSANTPVDLAMASVASRALRSLAG